MCAAHAGRDAGHTHRAVPGGVGAAFDLVYPVAHHRLAGYAEHAGRRAPGGTVTVIYSYAAPLPGHVDDHLAVAGYGGVPRLDHGEAEACGNGGVHGVSAALEDLDAGLGGDRVGGCDCAVLDDHLVLVGPPDAACVQRPGPSSRTRACTADDRSTRWSGCLSVTNASTRPCGLTLGVDTTTFEMWMELAQRLPHHINLVLSYAAPPESLGRRRGCPLR